MVEPEDEVARPQAELGDPQYSPCCTGSGNKFILDDVDLAAGSDGNVYLLHGASCPLIYVISPDGDVVRKLRIDPEDPDLKANRVKFYAGRLAIGFGGAGSVTKSLIKVIDLKGNPAADYEVSVSAGDKYPVLACYGSEGFTLIPRGADTKLHLLEAMLP